jgi:hypothetical protein
VLHAITEVTVGLQTVVAAVAVVDPPGAGVKTAGLVVQPGVKTAVAEINAAKIVVADEPRIGAGASVNGGGDCNRTQRECAPITLLRCRHTLTG